jgi:hypothetical protein
MKTVRKAQIENQHTGKSLAHVIIANQRPPSSYDDGLWGRRRGGDSNPRYLAVRRFSRPVHSATLPPLRGSRGLCGADCRQFADYVNHRFLIVSATVWFVIRSQKTAKFPQFLDETDGAGIL